MKKVCKILLVMFLICGCSTNTNHTIEDTKKEYKVTHTLIADNLFGQLSSITPELEEPHEFVMVDVYQTNLILMNRSSGNTSQQYLYSYDIDNDKAKLVY